MDSVFEVPWPDLSLDHVREFLEVAGDEGVTWEAKAGDPRRPEDVIRTHHVQRSVCGFANALGGFLILGAARPQGSQEWQLPGVVFPGDEPATWLDDVISSLRPRPRSEAHVWRVEDERSVALLRIEAIAEPPCMTAGGEIYERVSGKTVRVTDPSVLMRLLERGEGARVDAERLATTRLQLLITSDLMRNDEHLRACLALRATGYEGDITERLFREDTAERLRQVVREHLKPDRYSESRWAALDVRQDMLIGETLGGSFANDESGGDRIWRVWASWDGVVAIRCAANDRMLGIEMLAEEILNPAWSTAAAIVEVLGGFGSGHLVVDLAGSTQIASGRTEWGSGSVAGSKRMKRQVAAVEPNAIIIESLQRELMRALGFPVWEPDPGDSGPSGGRAR